MDRVDVSVVMPCLNEEEGIGICIRKIRQVFDELGIRGEIIVADNGSTDRSRGIAEEGGARVFVEEQPGYGAAYLCGLRQARGRYIVIADSDNSYDLCAIPEFLAALDKGNDFVMGSRFKGAIAPKAMPWLNRYVGNPILSGMCRLFFKTTLSDIHCGMRAFTREAYQRMELHNLGMEFATEMVVAALRNKLKIAEIPITYQPRKGTSKLVPFIDAWRHVRFMLLYSPLWLYVIPGLAGLLAGLCILAILLKGPFLFLGRYWDIHAMILGSVLSILSFQILNLGVFAHIFAIGQNFIPTDRFTAFLLRHFSLERGLFAGGCILFLGLGINLSIFLEWFWRSFGALHRIREAIFAMTLLVIGVQIMFSSFFVSLLFMRRK